MDCKTMKNIEPKKYKKTSHAQAHDNSSQLADHADKAKI